MGTVLLYWKGWPFDGKASDCSDGLAVDSSISLSDEDEEREQSTDESVDEEAHDESEEEALDDESDEEALDNESEEESVESLDDLFPRSWSAILLDGLSKVNDYQS